MICDNNYIMGKMICDNCRDAINRISTDDNNQL